MSFDAQLDPLLRKHHLEEFAAPIKRAIRPAVQFRKRMRKETIQGKSSLFGLIPGRPKDVFRPLPIESGVSKLGGYPELGEDFQWPERNGRPISLLAQISCAEVAALDLESLWPKTGSLLFFYDLEEYPWGAGAKDLGGWIVRYVEDPDQPTAEVSPDAGGCQVLPCFGLRTELFPSLPGSQTKALEKLGLGEAGEELFFELKHDLKVVQSSGFESMHRTLGYPDNIQGPVEDEWAGLAKEVGLRTDGGEWKLLLQFDSDNELDVMWGDAGMLYFGIQESALKARRFEEVMMTMQCG